MLTTWVVIIGCLSTLQARVHAECCAAPLTQPLPGAVPTPGVNVSKELFGEAGGQSVYRFTLSNNRNLSVQVMNYGAHLLSIRVPDKRGHTDDIVLGYDKLEDYFSSGTGELPTIGPIMGRVANRIANSTFTLDGKVYKLNPSNTHFTFHGGNKGWGKMVWKASTLADGVTFTLLSPDGDEHFPGAVEANVTFRVTAQGGLMIVMRAVSTKPTPISMYSHHFINLAGHGAGPEGINASRLAIYADSYLPLDHYSIPFGTVAPAKGTHEDLCAPRLLGTVLAKKSYDDILKTAKCNSPPSQMVKVARVEHDPSGRILEVYSDQPQMEFYTANGFPDPDAPAGKKVIGKNGINYVKHGALSFITMNFYDALHYKSSNPDTVLRPGSEYRHNMLFTFDVQRNNSIN